MNADNQRTPAAERLQNQAIDTVNTEEAEKLEPQYYHAPTNTTLTLTSELFMTGGDEGKIKEYAKRKQRVSHGAKVQVQTRTVTEVVPKNRKDQTTGKIIKRQEETTRLEARIFYETPAEATDLLFKCANELSPQSLKLFILFTVKLNEQALDHKGGLKQEYVSFPIHEIMGMGYTTERGAFQAFGKMAAAIIPASFSRTENKDGTGKGGVLFTDYAIQKSQCIIYLNPRANWNIIPDRYIPIPAYLFQLPPRAMALLYFILTLARQSENMRKIAKTGSFTIRLATIHQKLGLPEPRELVEVKGEKKIRSINDSKKLIKDPISDAVAAIEEAHSAIFGEKSLDLLFCCNNRVDAENAPIAEYLANGYLRVTIGGEFAEELKQTQKKKEDAAAKEEKRKERIVDTAKTRNLQKKMEAEEKQAEKNKAKESVK